MKHFAIRILMLAGLVMTTMTATYAQEATKVQDAVNKIVEKYENTEGVSCMTVVKGGGLEMIKMALNQEFGKSFMKGVTSITIIEYSEASQETCMAIRKDLDIFQSLLKDYDIEDEKEFAENDYVKCFAAEETGKLSDFVIAVENDSSKAVMYMAGEILIEEL